MMSINPFYMRYNNVCALCGGKMLGPLFEDEKVKQRDEHEEFACPLGHFSDISPADEEVEE